MRVAVEAANQKDSAGPQNDGNNGHYAAEYRFARRGAILRVASGSRLDRTGLAGANKLKTVPALIRPLGVRPNRLRKEDTYH
jgi:hypothetical protein